MSYQQGYDPKSLWDTGFFEDLWIIAKGVFVYIGIPVFLVWGFIRMYYW